MYFLMLCNMSWKNKMTPQSWHKASMVTLFKKGDATDMNNYRPISLLQISYKIFAAITLSRLKSAAAEKRIWKT